MELIKDITKQFYPLLIMLSCIAFVLRIFFSADVFGGEGVLESGGKIYAPMLHSDELKNDGLGYVSSAQSGYVPVAKYVGGAQCVGGQASFKNMFSVRKENGSFVGGSTEDEFALYLIDIQTESGNSVLAYLTADEIANMDEVPAAFIYDRENDELHFHGSGTYVVYVKIYGKSGGQTTYEFKLPVEASEEERL